MRAAQTRDRDAFRLLVEEHLGGVYRIAVAIVGPADAMDVTQETFLTAWQQLPRLRNHGAFGGWLRRICVNAGRQWLRQSRRRGVATSLDGDSAWAPIELVDRRPDFRAAVEARALLEPAIERLSPDQRAILALHYTVGLSIAETADALGIRTGTAKSRLNAGLQGLRTAVGATASVAEPETAP